MKILASPLRALYHWVLDLAARKSAPVWLAVVAFLESSVFPIPPVTMLVPMGLAKPKRVYWYAGLCSFFSVLGGIAGYAIGYFLYASVGEAIIGFYGKEDAFVRFQALYDAYGLWIILIAGFTPLPYKVATITSGFLSLSFPVFVVGSLISRASRYFLVAGLIHWKGVQIRTLIDTYLWQLTVIFLVILAGSFYILKYV